MLGAAPKGGAVINNSPQGITLLNFNFLRRVRNILEEQRRYELPLWARVCSWYRALPTRRRHWRQRVFSYLWKRQRQRKWVAPVCVEEALTSPATHGLSRYQELLAPVPVVLTPEECSTHQLPAQFCSDAPLLSRRAFVCQFAQPRFHPGEGLLVTRAGNVLNDSLFMPSRGSVSKVLGTPMPNEVPVVEGLCSSVWGIFDHNIYHWLVDALPRLSSLEMAIERPLTVLMPDTASSYHLESLKLCLPDNMEVQVLPSRQWVEVECFVFPSYVTQPQCLHLSVSHSTLLRQRVWQRLELSTEPTRASRIYVSRRKANSRRVVNEEEVKAMLEPLGFSFYDLEDLTFSEKVRLFYDAQIVVAPHGAGLSHILFSRETQVIELSTAFLPLHCFFLSRSLGHNYTRLLSPPLQSSDIQVSVAELEKAVAACFS